MDTGFSGLELRTSSSFYMLIGGILAPIVVLGIFTAITKDPSFWWLTLIIGLMLAMAMIVLWSAKLELTDEKLDYRCLFIRTTVALVDIAEAKSLMNFSGYKPFMRIEMQVRGESGEKEILMNVAWFERSQTRKLMQALDAKLAAMPQPSKKSGRQ